MSESRPNQPLTIQTMAAHVNAISRERPRDRPHFAHQGPFGRGRYGPYRHVYPFRSSKSSIGLSFHDVVSRWEGTASELLRVVSCRTTPQFATEFSTGECIRTVQFLRLGRILSPSCGNQQQTPRRTRKHLTGKDYLD